MPETEIDSHKSFEHVKRKVDAAVKSGELPREQAREVINQARKSYSNNDYNRAISKHNRSRE